jgi:SAM-dependent methyltransferase
MDLLYRLYKRKGSSFLDLIDVNRAYIRKLIELASKKTKEGSLVLDAGAGEGFWRYLFIHCEYYTQDLGVGESEWDYSKIDYKCDINNIPVENNKFDVILLTEVLEHLPEPLLALKELNRILKKEGLLYLTVPQGWREHEVPYDFFRYTSFGLKYLFNLSNFEVVNIERRGGYFKYIATRMWRFLRLQCMNRNKIITVPIKLIFIPFLVINSIICYLIDDWDKEKDLTLGYQVIAKKK